MHSLCVASAVPRERSYFQLTPLPTAAFNHGEIRLHARVRALWRLSDPAEIPLTVQARDTFILPEQTIAALKSMGHDVQIATASDVSFGGGQVALRHGEGWIGASDCRRDGQAVAF